MKHYQAIFLSVFSGILFSLGWPVDGYPALLFLAFVPLLIIERDIYLNKKSYLLLFLYTYLAFLIWNVLTTWWIWLSTPVAIAAWMLNALFMTTVILLFHATRRYVYRKNHGYLFFILYWIGFEYLHLNWELSWTWLNLGNGFASYFKWIQWYEYTGVLGGTLWVLTVNYLIFKVFNLTLFSTHSLRRISACISVSTLMILLPVLFSIYLYNRYEEKGRQIDVVVVQPNLDPYSEQYEIPPPQIVDLIVNLAITRLENRQTFIVCPESAIHEDIWEESMDSSPSLNRLKAFKQTYPNTVTVIGASTYKRYNDLTKIPYSARYHDYYDFWYDAFNTALLIDTSSTIQIHHKSRLTLGVEKMPSWKILQPLRDFAIDLGGTVGTLGVDPSPAPFITYDSVIIAPLICYESIFGEYCTHFVRKKANVFFIITNDGWWGNSPGHKQHLSFASLRAIENRRSIARSANTGISAFIDQKGEIHMKTAYWEPDVIAGSIFLNERLTFYSIHGDYIGRIAGFAGIAGVLITLMFYVKQKKRVKPQAV